MIKGEEPQKVKRSICLDCDGEGVVPIVKDGKLTDGECSECHGTGLVPVTSSEED